MVWLTCNANQHMKRSPLPGDETQFTVTKAILRIVKRLAGGTASGSVSQKQQRLQAFPQALSAADAALTYCEKGP